MFYLLQFFLTVTLTDLLFSYKDNSYISLLLGDTRMYMYCIHGLY